MLTQEIELTPPENARFEKNQLILSEEITKREWTDVGYHLSQLQGSVQFWIGDWIRFGNKKGYTSSDIYDEAVEITGLERETLRTFKWVAERTSSIRVDDLSFNHHRQVAPLGESEQIYYLNKAQQEKLSCAELRLRIIYEETPGAPVKDVRYSNDSPFPIRLGELHLKLQQEAFDMKSTIHERVVLIIREYFDKKEGKLIEVN